MAENWVSLEAELAVVFWRNATEPWPICVTLAQATKPKAVMMEESRRSWGMVFIIHQKYVTVAAEMRLSTFRLESEL